MLRVETARGLHARQKQPRLFPPSPLGSQRRSRHRLLRPSRTTSLIRAPVWLLRREAPLDSFHDSRQLLHRHATLSTEQERVEEAQRTRQGIVKPRLIDHQSNGVLFKSHQSRRRRGHGSEPRRAEQRWNEQEREQQFEPVATRAGRFQNLAHLVRQSLRGPTLPDERLTFVNVYRPHLTARFELLRGTDGQLVDLETLTSHLE